MAFAFAAVGAADLPPGRWPSANPSPIVLAVAAALGAAAGARAEAVWPAPAWWLLLSLPFAVTALSDGTDHLVFPLALAPLLRIDEGRTGPARALAAGIAFFLAAEAVGTVASALAGKPDPAPLAVGDSLAAGAIGLTLGFGGWLRVLFAGMGLGAAVAAWLLLRRPEPGQTMPCASCLCLAALAALALAPPG